MFELNHLISGSAQGGAECYKDVDTKTLKRLQDIQSLNEQDKADIFGAARCLPVRQKDKKGVCILSLLLSCVLG
jgi:hypothetical protein